MYEQDRIDLIYKNQIQVCMRAQGIAYIAQKNRDRQQREKEQRKKRRRESDLKDLAGLQHDLDQVDKDDGSENSRQRRRHSRESHASQSRQSRASIGYNSKAGLSPHGSLDSLEGRQAQILQDAFGDIQDRNDSHITLNSQERNDSPSRKGSIESSIPGLGLQQHPSAQGSARQESAKESNRINNGQAKFGDEVQVYNQAIRKKDNVTSFSESHYTVPSENMINLAPGEIQVGKKVIIRVPMSLFCLSSKNACRRFSAQISEHRVFETAIIILIIANMITMASRDYLDVNNASTKNQVLEYIDWGFSIVFVVEATLKIITSGFCFGKLTYLRNPWNVIDFAIVVAALMEIIQSLLNTSDDQLAGLKSLRVLRVLRPLKAVKSMPSIRLQVAALLSSLKQLANVMIFLLSMTFLAGVMGLQLFMESMHYACRETEKPLTGATTWPKVDTRICAKTGDNDILTYSGYVCSEGSFCGSPLEFGLEPDKDINYNVQMQYGFGMFSDIGDSLFTVIQMITMDNWTAIMYNIAQHESIWIPSFFAQFIIFIGSFLLLNLTLAVIMDSYDQTSQQMDLLAQEQLEKERTELEQRINRSQTMQEYAAVNNIVNQDQERIMEKFTAKLDEQVNRIQIMTKNQKVVSNQKQDNAVEKSAQHDSQIDKLGEKELSSESASDQFKELDKELLEKSNSSLNIIEEAKGDKRDSTIFQRASSSNMMKNLGSGLLGNMKGPNQSEKGPPPVSPGLERVGSDDEAPKAEASRISISQNRPAANPMKGMLAKGIMGRRHSDSSDAIKINTGGSMKNLMAKGMMGNLDVGGKQNSIVQDNNKNQVTRANSRKDITESPLKPERRRANSIRSVVQSEIPSVDPFQDITPSRIDNRSESGENKPKDASYLLARSQTLGQVSLKDRIAKSLLTRIAAQKQELEHIRARAQQLKQPEAQMAFEGIEQRAEAALELDNIEDKYAAAEQIRNEGNILMLRFQKAFTNKYLESKGLRNYGIKDEGNTLNIFRQNIKKSISSYKSGDGAAQHSKTYNVNSTNPLAAVLAMAKQKKEDEAAAKRKAEGIEEEGEHGELDQAVKRGMSKKRIGGEAQIKLVMQIKNNVDKQLEKQEIIAKMTDKINNILLQRSEMQTIIEETDAILSDDILRQRAQKNFSYRYCLDIEQSRYFEVTISICILLNTLVLALDQYPTSVSLLMFIEWANFMFYSVFVTEMIIKFVGLGFKIYFKDSANVFDFIIVIVSTIDFVFQQYAKGNSGAQYKAIQAMRMFRLLRVFKLAKIWPEFAYILVTVGNTIKKISAFLVLFLIFIFSFSILGMELFSSQLSFDENDKPVLDDYENGLGNMQGRTPDSTFNTFQEAIFSVFIVLANDGWSTIYFNHARVSREAGNGHTLPLIYFISLIIIGQNILFQLFLAILLQEFDERSLIAEENKKKEQQMQKNDAQQLSLSRRAINIIKNKCKCCTKIAKPGPATDEVEDLPGGDQPVNNEGNGTRTALNIQGDYDQDSQQPNAEDSTTPVPHNDDQQGGGGEAQVSNQDHSRDDMMMIEEQKAKEAALVKPFKANNRSLFLFSEQNCFRKLVQQVEQSNKFKNAILVLIIMSSLCLSQESPLLDPNSTEQHVLTAIDIFMTTIFGLEIIIKIIAYGFLFNGPKSFMRDVWSILDFTIVGIAIVSLGGDSDLGVFKILRMGKLLRPLRVLSRNEGLKVSIQALFVSIPAMLRLMLIVMLFYVIFSVMGINLLKGQIQHCDMTAVSLSVEQQIALIKDNFDCENYGGEWASYYKNFDTLPTALMQMYTMSRTVGWAEFMYRAIRQQGEGKQPDKTGQSFDLFAAFYYCFYIIFGAFFITNLFIGVVISTYNREKDRLGNNFMLSEEQRRWIETKLLVTRVQPIRVNVRPQNKLRSAMFTLSEHKWFEYFILVLISLNAIVMTFKYVGMSEEMKDTIRDINYVFTGIFCIETVIRLVAYGGNYFRENWYIFDFIIVVGSIAMIIVTAVSDGEDKSSNLRLAITIARLLRIFRLLRLFRRLKSLQQIFSTFLTTLPHMVNVGFLMLLIVYIYAVLGLNLFSQVKPSGILNNKFLGFTQFYKSFLTLIRTATGENWNELMEALSRPRGPGYECIDDPTWEDMQAAGGEPVGCGHSATATIFFVTYIFIVGLVFLNLFIAIILQGYYQTQEMDKQVVNREVMRKYQLAWAKFDPDASGFIKATMFAELMFLVEPPLGWSKSFRNKPKKQKVFIELICQNLKTYEKGEFIYFSDVLDAITSFHIIKSEVRADMEEDDIKFDSDDTDSEEAESEALSSASDKADNRKSIPSSRRQKSKSSSDSESDHDGGQNSMRLPSNLSRNHISQSSGRQSSRERESGKKKKKSKQQQLFENKIKQHEEMLKKAEGLGEVSMVKSLVSRQERKEKKITTAKFTRDSSLNQNGMNSLLGAEQFVDPQPDAKKIKNSIGVTNVDEYAASESSSSNERQGSVDSAQEQTKDQKGEEVKRERRTSIQVFESELDAIQAITRDAIYDRNGQLAQKQKSLIAQQADMIVEDENEFVDEELAKLAFEPILIDQVSRDINNDSGVDNSSVSDAILEEMNRTEIQQLRIPEERKEERMFDITDAVISIRNQEIALPMAGSPNSGVANSGDRNVHFESD